MADQDLSYARWEALGRPGGDFTQWQTEQRGGKVANPDVAGVPQQGGAAPPAYVEGGTHSPLTFQQRLDAGEFDNFPGGRSAAEAIEVQRLRGVKGTDTKQLPPDLADVALRDIATGRLRRARTGSTASALGSFSATRSLLGNA